MAEWNAQNPASAIEPMSQVVQVNNVVWREGSNSTDFMRSIAEALEDAAHDGPVRACYFVFKKKVMGKRFSPREKNHDSHCVLSWVSR